MTRSILGFLGAFVVLAAGSSCILVVGTDEYTECNGDEMTPCDGQCVDTSSDARHCGSCGEPCAGTCANGVCMPGGPSPMNSMPEPFAQASAPHSIAVDGAYVYFTDTSANTITQVSVSGGTVIPLASGQSTPQAIEVVGSYAYWLNTTSEYAIKRVLTGSSGGGVETAVSLTSVPCGFATDGTYVYWLDPSTAYLRKAPVGGSSMPIISMQLTGCGIALTNSAIYWLDTSSYIVKELLLPGEVNTPTNIATSQMGLCGIASDKVSGSVYWTNASGGTINGYTAPSSIAMVASNEPTPCVLAVDEESVYWANQGDGSIKKALRSGGAPVTLAIEQLSVIDIAVDGTYVYWTRSGSPTVWRIGKQAK